MLLQQLLHIYFKYFHKTIVAPEQQFGKPGCVGQKIKLAP
jgi:hypothetical protein